MWPGGENFVPCSALPAVIHMAIVKRQPTVCTCIYNKREARA